MKLDWSTLALQTINALILVWLLARFLFRPVAKIMAERQASANALMSDAKAAKLAAQAERDAAQAEREQLAAQRAQTLAHVESEAQAQRTALLAAAQEDASRLRAQAAAEIARERAAQADAASAEKLQLAVDIAGKLLDQLPDGMRVTAFIAGLANGVHLLSPAARAEMAEDASLRLTAPRALTMDERAACAQALATALGRHVEFTTGVDRALIAGLELSGTHGVVRNSWRDRLAQIHDGLLRDDGRQR
ncbi:F0F1 ATP synthase subunit B [Pandoraea cepalis]|uniref:ATP synthase subunit b n=1 Tax=Pandoraea cepalis TaxID=2508294 RepID=A0AAW7MSU4_9BURK|nr:F0F1 ATP synthase subunit B [Pandoraea cepalis]MDN4575923.1 F0F1 ATP synthase subunit B [Pandoraea cepalis]MDN4581025.1 F0F1 ATP synthase subunit B [Pandoraea cepalis]